MEPYYYQRLSKPMQEAYHAIKRGVESLSPAFPVPRLEMEQLSEVLFYLRWIVRRFSTSPTFRVGSIRTHCG